MTGFAYFNALISHQKTRSRRTLNWPNFDLALIDPAAARGTERSWEGTQRELSASRAGGKNREIRGRTRVVFLTWHEASDRNPVKRRRHAVRCCHLVARQRDCSASARGGIKRKSGFI